jgi:MoaE-MoaD fusion protein
MRVRVRLFAVLRERAGSEELELELPDGARVSDALARVEHVTEGLSVVMAVNHDYADPDAPLNAGDELALIPPVSGGSAGVMHARVTEEPLAPERVVAHVQDPRAGAVVSFLGVTREVAELHYEAYVAMAERKMAEIIADAVARHGLCAAAAEHRIGVVAL